MLTIALVVAAVVAIVAIVAATAFERRIRREIDAVSAEAYGSRTGPVGLPDLDKLPHPVQQWLQYSGVIGTTPPSTVRLRQQGEFDLGRGWMPFTAEQYFMTGPPGFVWKASFRMAPMLWVIGRDQYRAGVGSIDMRLLSLVPVARKTGGGLNQGALLRFLGEMQWFPAAALSDYIRWEAVDATSARATMSYGGISASMMFIFGGDGRLLEERATRYNDARGRDEAWGNRNDADRKLGGFVLPAVGEARWDYAEGPFPYIRWTITSLEQDRPARYEN
jgi:hypothetical protein